MVEAMETVPMDVIPSPTIIGNLPVVTSADVAKTVSYLVRGVELNQPRLLSRAIRQNAKVRRHIPVNVLNEVLTKYITSNLPTYEVIMTGMQKLATTTEVTTDINTEKMETDEVITSTTTIPEVEIYLFTLLVTTLLRFDKTEDAAYCATALIERIKSFNRRSLDILSSKAYFYFSLAYERIDRLENIRSALLSLYRSSCVHHDELSQAVLVNLILRNYIHSNLFSQAQILTSKTTFPEHASNNQYCRYLYYEGRIQTVQLLYSDAYVRLTMAARKAPQDASYGFIIEIQKLTIIVQLLMGDIPERSLFNQTDLRTPLKPYFYLTQAVRNGNLPQFNKIVEKYSDVFENDKNLTLIHRLGFNVLKIGLRKIYLSYSRISLKDIAEKLCLPSIASAEYICAKAIRDGMLEASLDHEQGYLTSNDVLDVYSTEEPQKAFHRRIAFCLDVHNEAIKSMRYPPDAYKKELKQANDKKQVEHEDEKSIEELIRDMENDSDGDI